MLYKTPLETNTLELIKEIQAHEEFKSFYLAGGTALAVQIGHRKSIDLDFFTTKDFDIEYYLNILENQYNFIFNFSSTNTIKGIIGTVHVDFIAHKYPLLKSPIIDENIGLVHIQDIAAMKVNAIVINGTRVKDFIDFYYLLDFYSFGEIIAFFEKKYSQRNSFLAVKSLIYFNDVDLNEWPVMLKEPDLKWNRVKERILMNHNDFMNH